MLAFVWLLIIFEGKTSNGKSSTTKAKTAAKKGAKKKADESTPEDYKKVFLDFLDTDSKKKKKKKGRGPENDSTAYLKKDVSHLLYPTKATLGVLLELFFIYLFLYFYFF